MFLLVNISALEENIRELFASRLQQQLKIYEASSDEIYAYALGKFFVSSLMVRAECIAKTETARLKGSLQHSSFLSTEKKGAKNQYLKSGKTGFFLTNWENCYAVETLLESMAIYRK